MIPDDEAEPIDGTGPDPGNPTPGAGGESNPFVRPNPGEATPMPPPGFSPGGNSEEDRPAPEERPPTRETPEREVKVLNVYQYPSEDRGDYTFVLLQDGRDRKLPIFIGQPEAVAIVMGLQKDKHDFHRPLTHDLLRNAVEKLGGKIERLTIDDMWQDTFYARLVVSVGEKWIDIDCRPSDGIAVALRAEAPIYVSEQVLEDCHYREE